MARFKAAVNRFCDLPMPREDGPVLATYLRDVQGVIDQIAAKSAEAAAAFAETDHYDNQGFATPQHWLRVNLHLTGGAASDRIAVGQQMHNIPESHQSLLEGEIGFAHLAHIARTAAAIEEAGTHKPFDETPLLEKARELPVGRFIDFTHHMRHAGDPEGYAAEQTAKVEARSLSIRTGEGGIVWVRAVFDPEGGAIFRTAVESMAKPNG